MRHADQFAFAGTRWRWRHGEQWALLGPNGSGKSLFGRILAGAVPVARGEMACQFGTGADARGNGSGLDSPEGAVALLSPATQREVISAEGSFYQSRWHSGVSEGHRTVGRFLAYDSVWDINPFEVGARRPRVRQFVRVRRRLAAELGLRNLFRRQLLHLSNGEQRRVLLAHTLLRQPRLLVLDDPFGGLDTATRARLKAVLQRLMRAGLPVLVITSRPDEIPPGTTHVLLVSGHRVVGQGGKGVMLRHPLARRLSGPGHTPPGRGVLRGRPPPALAAPGRRQAAASHGLKAAPVAAARTDPAGPPLVELRRINLRFGRRAVLRDFDWTLRAGERWALLGRNGTGKTTLLSLIQGDNPRAYAQRVFLFGRRLDDPGAWWQTRQRMGWLSPEFHLHYPLVWTCLEVVCSGFFQSVGLYERCTAAQRAAARAWLRLLRLEGAAPRPLGEVSLGDQRLVLLARAAVRRPPLLLLDEPCQGLDATHRRAVLAAVDTLVAETGASLVFTTHHARELPECVTRILRLRAGRGHSSRRGPLGPPRGAGR